MLQNFKRREGHSLEFAKTYLKRKIPFFWGGGLAVLTLLPGVGGLLPANIPPSPTTMPSESTPSSPDLRL